MIRRLLAIAALFWTLAIPATATVNSSTNKTIALGNGSQTVFTFSFIGVAAQYITVIYTDASGNETVLTQGSGTTQYQITLNAPVQGAIWGLGGTITYNPSSVPIATGTSLTIFRTLPLTQAITLQNQSSIATLGKGAETGLDTGVMQGQQINEAISRALQMNITNQAAPLPLPPAAQLANQGLCGDGTGNNIIACSLAPAGVISSAMAPVVGAATLAAGRTAFGLGSMAVENINGGSCGGASLQDDGAGNARVVPATAQDSTNQAVPCSWHLNYRVATGPLTYTLARANATYFNGFSFTINSAAGTTTVTPNASDNFKSVASGVGISIPPGVTCTITTDAASSAVWYPTCTSSQPSLTSSNNGTALTISVQAVSLSFFDPVGGGSVTATPAGNLSITVPSGATLGTSSSNVPFRIWIFVAYNAGNPVLGVATCSIATAIYPCSSWETVRKSGTGITSGSTAAGTLYTSASVSNNAVRIIGYMDYGTGLGTAGTWASNPTMMQACIPPFTCKRPGDVMQTVYNTTTTIGTAGNTSFVAFSTGQSQAITPTSSPNLVKVSAAGDACIGGAILMSMQVTRGGSAVGPVLESTPAASSSRNTMVFNFLDAPGSAASQTYAFQGKSPSATINYPCATTTGVMMTLDEIMGALPEPANDNGSTALRMVG